jgi:cbb3-type cytochrome oxidase subunit 3
MLLKDQKNKIFLFFIFLIGLIYVLLWAQTRSDLYLRAKTAIYLDAAVKSSIGEMNSLFFVAYRKKSVTRGDHDGINEVSCAQYDFFVFGNRGSRFVQVKLQSESPGSSAWKLAHVVFWDKAESSCYI